jgi:hypothetical protein
LYCLMPVSGLQLQQGQTLPERLNYAVNDDPKSILFKV